MTSITSLPNVRKAASQDRAGIVAVLSRAFAGDRIIRWLFPDDDTYSDRAAAFFGYMFDIRIEGGEIYVTGDVAGASLWDPPGGNRNTDDFLEQLWVRTMAPHGSPDELERYAFFARLMDSVTPTQPHWYLGVLGTLPERQRAGLAQAVVAPVFAQADRDGIPVFLETGMPGNVEIYRRRFGFDVLDEADVPGGPHVWGLIRRPRRLDSLDAE
jgi:GNAT superfamily N-acetyltransferase